MKMKEWEPIDPAGKEWEMNRELRNLTAEEILERTARGEELKGIANANDWDHAYTVTLTGLLKVALEMNPSIVWLLPVDVEPKAIVPVPEQIEQDVVQSEQEYDYHTFGTRVAGLLSEMGMAQRELAEIVGVTDVSMARYIRGDRIPKAPIVANIANALNTTTDYLFGFVDVKEAEQPNTPIKPADEGASMDSDTENSEIEDVECAREAAKHIEINPDVIKAPAVPEGFSEYTGEVEDPDTVKHTTLHNLGKWAEYQGKALDKTTQNEVIKGMKDEGYALSVIGQVVRLTAPSIRYRLNKMEEQNG